MDAMNNIIQIVERGEAALAGMIRLGRNPNPGLEVGVVQSIGQIEGPSETTKGTSSTQGQANGSYSPESQYTDTASSEPQYIPYTAVQISGSDDTFNATTPLTSHSEWEPETSTPPGALPLSTTTSSSSTTTTTTSSSYYSTTTTTSSSSSSSSITTTTETVPSGTDTTDTGASNSPSSTNTKLAIALPIVIISLLIAALTFFFLRRRRRRNAQSQYDIATGQTKALSTAELMALQKTERSGPASNIHHLPVIQVSQYQGRASSPGSASARTVVDDSHMELGLAVAVPLDQRRSASEHDLPRFSGSASSTSTPRMPFESRGDGGANDDDDDDDVSVVSDLNERRNRERDFDDMSSVSSFDDDEDEQENGHNGGSSR